MKKYFAIMILLTVLQSSCRTDSAEDLEMNALIEIFDDLIEKMDVMSKLDLLHSPPPPLPPSSSPDVENEKIFEEFERKMKDTTAVIAVSDTLSTLYNDYYLDVIYIKSMLKEDGYINALNGTENKLITSRPLDLSKIGNKERLTLKYSSEFPKGREIWNRENYNFLFSGVLDISRIYFDQTNKFGIFECSYSCTSSCGEGYIICIRKINNKWTIQEMILLWIV
jgi:hypothetical protein